MSKELDNVLSDTFKEYIELVGEPAKPTLKKRIVDSCLFSILFFPILNLIDGLKDLKNQRSVDTVDIIGIWGCFLASSLLYIMVLVACCGAIYKFCALPSVNQIIIASIIVILISIIVVPVWVIRKWVNKK
jgi:hypothetical protein